MPANSFQSVPRVRASQGPATLPCSALQIPGSTVGTATGPRGARDSSSTLGGSERVRAHCHRYAGRGRGQWVSVPHTPLLHPTMSVAQGTGRSGRRGPDSQRAGAGQAGISCARLRAWLRESPEISEGWGNGAGSGQHPRNSHGAISRDKGTLCFLPRKKLLPVATAGWSQRWAATRAPSPAATKIWTRGDRGLRGISLASELLPLTALLWGGGGRGGEDGKGCLFSQLD